MSKFTVKEIKEQLDQENIKYTSKMSKQQLLELMPTVSKDEPKGMPKEMPNVLISQKHFRFNPVTENVEPVVQKATQNVIEDVIDIVFNEACKNPTGCKKKPEKSKRQRKVKEEVKEEDVTPKTPSSLWVSTLKEYNKDKKYKIHKKDSDEYKEILELYNKKKTSKQV